ncbi:hypothetical protein ACLEPN_43730, partial [Myxococcus sp. 1LA]
MDNRGRRRVWLVVAAMLFVVAAVLMFTGQGDEPAMETPQVEFPRRMRAPERERAERRRTLVLPVQVDAGT